MTNNPNQNKKRNRDLDFERIAKDRARGFNPRERDFQARRTQPQSQRNFQPERSFFESWNRAGEVLDTTFVSFPPMEWDSLGDLFSSVQREQFRRRK